MCSSLSLKEMETKRKQIEKNMIESHSKLEELKKEYNFKLFEAIIHQANKKDKKIKFVKNRHTRLLKKTSLSNSSCSKDEKEEMIHISIDCDQDLNVSFKTDSLESLQCQIHIQENAFLKYKHDWNHV